MDELLLLFTRVEEDDVQLGAEENDKADHCRQTVQIQDQGGNAIIEQEQ